MSERTPISVLDGLSETPRLISATLIDGVTVKEAAAADSIWIPYMNRLVDDARRLGVPRREIPKHRDWKWGELLQVHKPKNRHIGIDVDGEMQGLLWLHAEPTSRSQDTLGKPLVYIERVSVAPWNYQRFLALMGRKPRYRGCGTIFMLAAIEASKELGYEGRIGLHALPNAEAFYRKCGMKKMELDLDHEDLHYFEMSASQARTFEDGLNR